MEPQNSKERIQDALLNLLAEKPLEKITVTEVCRGAQVSRTTYYRSYDSLESIVEDILKEIFDQIQQVVPFRRDGDPAPSGMAQQVVTYQALDLYRRNMKPLRTILESDAAPLLRKRINAMTKRYLWVSDDTEPLTTQERLERNYMVAGMVEITSNWLAEGCNLDIEELVRFMLRMAHHSEEQPAS